MKRFLSRSARAAAMLVTLLLVAGCNRQDQAGMGEGPAGQTEAGTAENRQAQTPMPGEAAAPQSSTGTDQSSRGAGSQRGQ